MVKINLKRAIQLPDGSKTNLRPGRHSIEDDVFSHWYIQGLVRSGEIVVMKGAIQKTKPLNYKINPLGRKFPAVNEIKPVEKVEEINKIPEVNQQEVVDEKKIVDKVQEIAEVTENIAVKEQSSEEQSVQIDTNVSVESPATPRRRKRI